MLLFLRSSVSKIAIKLLFVVLVASFAVWGIGDIFQIGIRSDAPIEVGPVQIGPAELQNEYRRQFSQLQARYGGSLDTETANALGLDDRVVNDLVARTLVAVYTDRTGMRVDDDTVRRAIQNDPVFRNEAGQFDRGRFDAWLRQTGMSEAALVARLRNDIARTQLTASLVAGIQVPTTLVNAVHDYRSEARVAETLRIAAADMTGIAEPDEDDLAAFHQENADRYQAPERRAVTVVRLSPEALADEISVPEDEIAAAFESRKAEFDQPERRQLEQIVFADELTAKGAAEEARSGVDFAEIARKATGGEPIDLGTVDKQGLAGLFPQLADAAFAVPEGGISDPIETALGWHVVRVLSVEPAREATLAGHRDQIARDLALQQATDSIVSIANQFEDELAGGATLEEAASKLDLDVVQIPGLDAQGKDAEGATVPAADAEPSLAATAFETAEGELSPLTDAADGGYYMLRVDAVTPAAIRPLEEVRDRVRADWMAAQRAKAAEERAAALVERLEGGASMAEIATELGQEVKTSGALTRDGSDAAAWLDSGAVAKLFTLEQGGVAAAPAGDDQVIMRLAEIRQPAPTDQPAVISQINDSLRGAMAADLVNGFMAAVQQEIPVSIDQASIENLF
ncbi:MAG: hypothetical protein BroJett029_03320 [Alphaproteobacteria bacterium]|nr:MAG: hypothetical protein BroJett029_03320 [Alphaproteobacteria bacterium]